MIVSSGGLAGIAFVLLAALLPWQNRTVFGTHLPRCQPYFLIPREKVCARRVFYRNPDGTLVDIGSRVSFAPMPAPHRDR